MNAKEALLHLKKIGLRVTAKNNHFLIYFKYSKEPTRFSNREIIKFARNSKKKILGIDKDIKEERELKALFRKQLDEQLKSDINIAWELPHLPTSY